MKLYILFWYVYKWTIVTYGMEVRTQVSTTCDWLFAFTTPLMHRYNGQKKMWRTWKISRDFYTLRNEVSGRILDSPCPSVCPLTFRVRPVASTVQNGFFPYLVQMINSMRGCVACDDPWPWPISSKVIRPWLRKSCPFCSVYSSEFWMDSFYIWHKWSLLLGGVACYVFFSDSGNLNF